MTAKTIFKIGIGALVGYATISIVRMFNIPQGSILYDLLHPEQARLRNELNKEQRLHVEYWDKYIQTRSLGVDRVQTLLTLFRPIPPQVSFGDVFPSSPFKALSFAQLQDRNGVAFPGLPTQEEWNRVIIREFERNNLEQAEDLVNTWSDYGSWPTPVLE